MNNSPYILIMAGGAGTRFWPASRENLPKQFLDITGTGKTLIRKTVDRFLRFIPLENIFVITHKQYIHLVKKDIPELPTQQIIGEPSRNNTAASIAYASMKLSKLNPEAVCIVSPADHLITEEKELGRILGLAVSHATREDSIITLGIEPTRPDTGYGYIEFDKKETTEVRKVKSFREKPDDSTVRQYIDSGSFAWNSGIFIWKLPTILNAFKKHASQIFEILEKGTKVYNTEGEEKFIESEYPKTEKISVDFAIMERAENVFTIPCDIGWSDLGTWNSLYDQSPKDENKNVSLSKPVYLESTSNSLILSRNEKLVVIKGLEDFIIVDTEDCLLIYPRSEEQSIKALKEKLNEKGFDQFL